MCYCKKASLTLIPLIFPDKNGLPTYFFFLEWQVLFKYYFQDIFLFFIPLTFSAPWSSPWAPVSSCPQFSCGRLAWLPLVYNLPRMVKHGTVQTLCSTVLYCTALDCTLLHCTELYCTVLHCTALHCSVLHCTAHNYKALVVEISVSSRYRLTTISCSPCTALYTVLWMCPYYTVPCTVYSVHLTVDTLHVGVGENVPAGWLGAADEWEAVQCSALQCTTVQWRAVQCSSVLVSPLHCYVAQCNLVRLVQCNTVQCSTAHINKVQFSISKYSLVLRAPSAHRPLSPPSPELS